MNDLVLIDPKKMDGTPFTTSGVISEWTGVSHKKLKEAIRKYQNEIESFGLLVSYQTESTGGRPETHFRLNEEQATFLLTLLKNTPVVVEFKKRLVKAFYLMRRELMKRQVERAKLIPVRREMTDVIRDCLPESPHKQMWYKHYNDLVYKTATGMTASQIRKERGAPKEANATVYLTSDEMLAVQKTSGWVSSLVELGFSYEQVKTALIRRAM